MNAVVLRETGAPEVLRLDSAPDPEPGPGEVVVALRAAALNRRDVFLRKGIAPSPLPVIPGSDGAGVVRSLGPGASGVAEGDEVVILPSLGWGGGEAAPGARLPHPRRAGRRHLRRADRDPGRQRLPAAVAALLGGVGGAAARGPDGLPRPGEPGGRPPRARPSS